MSRENQVSQLDLGDLAELYEEKVTIPSSYMNKHSNLFESLISTNLEKSPFQIDPKQSQYPLEDEEIDLLKVEELIPNYQMQKNSIDRQKGRVKKKQHLDSQYSEQHYSEDDQMGKEIKQVRKKHKKPNRSVSGSSKNILIFYKNIIMNYLRRKGYGTEGEGFLRNKYMSKPDFVKEIRNGELQEIFQSMFQQRYLQRAVVGCKIPLDNKTLFLKKIKFIEQTFRNAHR